MRVLVVEDEELVRLSVVEFLAEEGFEVLEAATGDEALAYFTNTHSVDVLFTDIRMPGKTDGWELARQGREAFPDIAVIYATGCSDEAASSVAGSMLFKQPYRMTQVLAAIRVLTEHREISEKQG